MSYKFVQNKSCEYFPCHKGVKEEDFNCLLCFCPLYALKNKCGGNFKYLDNGVKSCENCIIPHEGEGGYDRIMEKITNIIELGKLEDFK